MTKEIILEWNKLGFNPIGTSAFRKIVKVNKDKEGNPIPAVAYAYDVVFTDGCYELSCGLYHDGIVDVLKNFKVKDNLFELIIMTKAELEL